MAWLTGWVYALSSAFLAKGYRVTRCGRDSNGTDRDLIRIAPPGNPSHVLSSHLIRVFAPTVPPYAARASLDHNVARLDSGCRERRDPVEDDATEPSRDARTVDLADVVDAVAEHRETLQSMSYADGAMHGRIAADVAND